MYLLLSSKCLFEDTYIDRYLIHLHLIHLVLVLPALLCPALPAAYISIYLPTCYNTYYLLNDPSHSR